MSVRALILVFRQSLNETMSENHTTFGDGPAQGSREDLGRIPPEGVSPSVRDPVDDEAWTPPTVAELVDWMVEREETRQALEAALAKKALDTPEERDRFLALVDVVVDLSRLEAGRRGLDPEMVDLRGAVEAAHRSLREGAEGLVLRIDDALPEEVYADSDQLERVLAALVSIAAPADAGGETEVRVERAAGEPRRQGATSMLKFEVRGGSLGDGDAGDLLRASSPVPEPGRRLGLTVCTELVSLMGGQLSAGIDPDEDGAFWLTFPGTSTMQGVPG